MKYIVITGINSGIGLATAESFLAVGDVVIGSIRNLSSMSSDVQNLKNKYGQKLILWPCDFLNLDEVDSIHDILKQHGITQIHGLINNAGIATSAPFQFQNFSEISNTITTNVLSVMKLTQLLIPYMIQVQGRIVNISSVSGTGGAPFLAAYCASKHAIEGFSESLRREMKIHGIQVVVIGPGSIKTPIWSKGFENIREKYQNTVYVTSFDKFLNYASNEALNALPVSAVVDDIQKAMNSPCPKIRYAPIPRKFLNKIIPMLLPKRVYDFLTVRALGLLP